jgi:hypothetical protein
MPEESTTSDLVELTQSFFETGESDDAHRRRQMVAAPTTRSPPGNESPRTRALQLAGFNKQSGEAELRFRLPEMAG